MLNLNEFFKLAIERNASDLHLIPGYPLALRIEGEIHLFLNYPTVTAEDLESTIFSLLNEEQKQIFITNRELDLSLEFETNRFRTNIYYSKNGISASFRIIPKKIRTLEELNLPTSLYKICDLKQGFVLITGPTSHGKSTTLAALINAINLKYNYHIITIEDPIEYVFPQAQSIISQRELYSHTFSWDKALKTALREDPNVIFVGEMRDFETISLALTAAETGHLVFSTLHTNSAPETIDRIIDAFPSHQQNQIRIQLASVLKMTIVQKLLPRANDLGRVPAVEILVNTPAVATLIREGKTHLLNGVLETEEKEGSILFEKYLANLYQQGLISKNDAFSYAIRPKELEKFISR